MAAALDFRPRKHLDWKTPAEALDMLLLSGNNDSVARPLEFALTALVGVEYLRSAVFG